MNPITQSITLTKPNIFEFTTIIDFLQNYYKYRKTLEKHFSYELWTSELSMKSKSSLRSICFGKRPVPPDLINEIAKKQKMSKQEKRYLTCLVELNNIKKNQEIRDIFINELFSISDQRIRKIDFTNTNDFLHVPQLYLIHILIAFEDFHATPSKIAKFLGISTEKTQQLMNRLVDLDLAEIKFYKSEKVWKSKNKFFSVKPDSATNISQTFHENTADEIKAVVNQDIKDKKIKSLFFSLNELDFPGLANEIDEFLNRLKNKYLTDFIDSKKVYKVNVSAYPLTKTFKND